jgi:hypothetical protein
MDYRPYLFDRGGDYRRGRALSRTTLVTPGLPENPHFYENSSSNK